MSKNIDWNGLLSGAGVLVFLFALFAFVFWAIDRSEEQHLRCLEVTQGEPVEARALLCGTRD